MIRSVPNTRCSGGSSGCMASITPSFSHTGSTFSRKRSSVSQSLASVMIGGPWNSGDDVDTSSS